MKYGNNEEELVHTDPLSGEGEDDSLDEESDASVDGHDHPDGAEGQTQTSR